MADNQVRPKAQKLTDDDVLRYLAAGLVRTCAPKGACKRVALETGNVDERTIRRARDGEHLLRADTIFNLLDADEHVLDEILAAKGHMLMPLFAAAADVIPTAGAAIHRIGSNRAPESPGGAIETDGELIASEAENDALLGAVLDRRAAIARAKLRRASAAA